MSESSTPNTSKFCRSDIDFFDLTPIGASINTTQHRHRVINSSRKGLQSNHRQDNSQHIPNAKSNEFIPFLSRKAKRLFLATKLPKNRKKRLRFINKRLKITFNFLDKRPAKSSPGGTPAEKRPHDDDDTTTTDDEENNLRIVEGDGTEKTGSDSEVTVNHPARGSGPHSGTKIVITLERSEKYVMLNLRKELDERIARLEELERRLDARVQPPPSSPIPAPRPGPPPPPPMPTEPKHVTASLTAEDILALKEAGPHEGRLISAWTKRRASSQSSN